jgi:glycosyltransferase involved in cell wall biosynthesis
VPLPFVSIVVPFYNEKRYLEQCIQALLTQQYPRDRYEVILVNDGSEDGSEKIAQALVDARRGQLPSITYVQQRHSGLSTARNAGISAARGDIIAYIEGDALAEPGWLSGLAAAFGDDASIGVVGGKIDTLNDQVAFARFIHWIHYYWPTSGRGERILIIGTNMAFRRAVFEQVGGFFADFRQRGDETAFLLKVRRLFNSRTTADAVVRHERPITPFKWLRERYHNGYFYASTIYILRQIRGTDADIRAHLVRHLLIVNNVCIPIWLGLLAVWPVWPVCGVALLSLLAFGTFIWTRRRIWSRLDVLRREYGFMKATILAPCAVALIAQGEYLRALGFVRGLWDFRHRHFDDNLLTASELIECTCVNM